MKAIAAFLRGANHDLLSSGLLAYLLAAGTLYLFLAPVGHRMAPGTLIETLLLKVPLVLALSAAAISSVFYLLNRFMWQASLSERLLRLALGLAVAFTVLANLACIISEQPYLVVN